MAIGWTWDQAAFVAATVVQAAVGIAILVRSRRTPWLWALGLLFLGNTLLSTVSLLRTGFQLRDHIDPQAAQAVAWFGDYGWIIYGIDVATSFLIIALAAFYPRPLTGPRGVVATWVAVAVGAALIFVLGGMLDLNTERAPADLATALFSTLVQATAWCVLLLRWSKELPEAASPGLRSTLMLLLAAFGLRAVHASISTAVDNWYYFSAVLHEPGDRLAATVVSIGIIMTPLVPASLACYRLLSNAQSVTSRRASVFALWFIFAGVIWGFLFGAGSLLPNVNWLSPFQSLDLYVVRPLFVMGGVLAVLYPGVRMLERGSWQIAAGLYTAGLTYVAASSAIAPQFQGRVASALFLLVLSAGAGLAAAAWVRRRGGAGQADAQAPATGANVEAYVAALEEAQRTGTRETDGEAHEDMRARLGITHEQHVALAHAVATRWAAPGPDVEWASGDLVLGRYKLRHILGQGGAARAWLAHDALEGRDVVLKRSRHMDRDGRRGLANEAAALRRLRERALVPILRVERLAQEPILVLPWMAGGSLEDRLRRGPMAPVEVARLGVAMANALHAAHQAGIIHRDVKPSNVLLDAEGQPHLGDFGLAAVVAGPSWADHDATVADAPGPGTLRYSSPAQIQGLSASVSDDVYSLAVVLGEAVTGRHPLRSIKNDFDLRRRAVAGLRFEWPARLPEAFRDVLEAALSPRPEYRPDSARALGRQLDALLRGETPLRPGPTRTGRRSRPTAT